VHRDKKKMNTVLTFKKQTRYKQFCLNIVCRCTVLGSERRLLGCKQWRSQDLEVGGTGGLENGSPPAVSRGRAPVGWFGGA